MKNKYLLLTLLLAFFAPWAANAQSELTVYEGTTTNDVIPAYVFYFDDFTRSQFVIPADDLAEMSGGTITALKFYTNSSNIPYTAVSSANVYLMEVDYTTMTGLESTASSPIAYQGYFDFVSEGEGGSLTIALSTPYTYGGGNLLVAVENTEDNGWKHMYFYGQTVTGAAWGGSNGSSLENVIGSVKDFIPKTTFTYEPASTGCDMPTAIAVSNITPNGAQVTWEGDGTAWNLRYKASTDADYTLVEGLTTKSYALGSLTENTAYSVGVQTVCSGSTSSFRSTSFTTANPCAAPTNLQFANITGESATVTWTPGYQETSWTVKYKKSSETEYLTETVTGTPTLSLTGLEGLTTYNVQVYNCENYVSGNFTTAAGFPYSQDFSASGIPTGWTQYTGLLEDVMAGTALTSTSYGWSNGTSNGVLDGNNIYANIYSTSCKKWIVTPAIPIPAGARLTFDVAYTAYSGTAADPDQSGDDDKFVVLASTDNMATWTILRQWDNAGSEYVLNDLTPATLSLNFDMAAYEGTSLNIAFYAESTVSNTDNNIHVDNVVFELIPSCEKPLNLAVNYTSGVTAEVSWTSDASAWNLMVNGTQIDNVTNPYTLTSLELATTYNVAVQANCGGNDVSEWTNPVSFNTDLCMPENQCELTFVLTDSYGDTWNGNAINVVDVLTGSVIASMTNDYNNYSATGSSGSYTQTKTLAVCDGREIQFTWVSGSYPGETSYEVYDVNGEEIFSGSGAMSEPVNYTVNCTVSTCRKPTDFAVSEIGSRSAKLSWTENGEATAWNIKCNGTVVASNVTNPYTLTGLTPETAYTVQVCPVCEVEKWSDEISFTTDVACPAPSLSIADGDVGTYSATITITGEASTYNVRYRTARGFHYTFEQAEAWAVDNVPPCTTYDGDQVECYGLSGYDLTDKNFPFTGAVINFQNGETNFISHSGNAFGLMVCPNDASPADDWFILPEIAIENGYEFSFWGREITTQYGNEIINVGIYGDTEGTFASLLDGGDQIAVSSTEYTKYTFDLSAYAGQTIRLAINYVSQDIFGFLFDDIFVGNPADDTWDVVIENVTSPYEITGLVPETDYEVQAQAVCGGEDGVSVWSQTSSFRTKGLCDVPTNLTATNIEAHTATLNWDGAQNKYNVQYRTKGYREELFYTDFDNGSLPDGWTNTGGLYYWTGGSDYFVLLGYTAAGSQYLISSDLTAYEGAATIEFKQRYYGDAMTFKVGFSSTTNDVEAFAWGDDVTATSSETLYSVAIPAGAKYFAIQATTEESGTQGIVIDDLGIYGEDIPAGTWVTSEGITATTLNISGLAAETEYEWQAQGVNTSCDGGVTEWSALATFTTAPSCLVPTNLEVKGITDISAIVAWESTAALFDIEVNGVVTEGVTNPYELEGLEGSTIYTVRVRANCGAEDGYSDWTEPYAFVTDCGGAKDLPYAYDFEDLGDYYACWQSYSLSSANAVGLYTDPADNTNVVFRFSSWTSDPESTYTQILVSPELNAEAFVNVSFDYKPYTTSYGNETFSVGYATGDFSSIDDFVWAYDVVADDATQWTTFSKALPVGTKYVAILYTSSYASHLYIDNFNFRDVTQVTDLVAGWNWVSLYVDVNDPVDMLDMLKESLGENGLHIESIEYSTEFDGEEWFGDMDDEGIYNEEMYLIEVIRDCSISLEGTPADPADYSITIQPGYNWIGFPSAEEIDIADAMADFEAEEGDIIEDHDGSTEFDGEEWFGDIDTFVPGKGYLYYSASDETKTLVFLTGAKKARKAQQPVVGTLMFKHQPVKPVVNCDGNAIQLPNTKQVKKTK